MNSLKGEVIESAFNQSFKHLHRKKCDLALVIFLVIKETITADARASHPFELMHRKHRMFTCCLTMAAKEIVAWRGLAM